MRFFVSLLPALLMLTGCAAINPWKKPVDSELADMAGFEERKGLFGGSKKKSLTTQVRKAVGKGPDKEIARQLYAAGDKLYQEAVAAEGAERRRKFLKASEQYLAASKRWPDSAVEEDALFMTGDSLFFADHYEDANQYFEQLLKKYPSSRHLDRCEARRFSIARYWEQKVKQKAEPFYRMNFVAEDMPFRDADGNALRVYDKIRIDDPTGRLADDATMAAANLHFEKGKYILADEYYTDLRRTFPNSDHQFMAHFLGLRAKLASYQGTDYSGTVLKQAEELIQQMLTQFPTESREHTEYLAKAAAEVKLLLAEREWADGQYYDRRKEFGAARFHYARLIRDYPSTPLADKARQRIENLNGLPDIPEQKLQWLVNLFPEQVEPQLKMLDDSLEGQDSTMVAQGEYDSQTQNR